MGIWNPYLNHSVLSFSSENEGTKGFEKDDKRLEERENYRSMKDERHHSAEETTQAKEPSRVRDTGSEEMGEEPSKDLEDAKRWNKMDELAKQLTTTKRAEENESDEDPDRSMKVAFRSRKYDLRNPEDETRSPQEHHSKEDTSEGGFPLVALPEEKKDEEGSANRRTEVGYHLLQSFRSVCQVLENCKGEVPR